MGHAEFDLIIVGGGLSGCAAARDAAGRGLSVLLVERGDLGGGSSSATRGLAHGELQPWETNAAACASQIDEREQLLNAAPQLVQRLPCLWPVLPGGPGRWRMSMSMASARRTAPRAPRPKRMRLPGQPLGRGLAPGIALGVLGHEASLDAPRLALLMARDAAERGATIAPRCELVSARVEGGRWQIELTAQQPDAGGLSGTVSGGALLLAAGGWLPELYERLAGAQAPATRSAVSTSLLVRRVHDGDHALVVPRRGAAPLTVVPFEHHWSLVCITGEASAVQPGAQPGEALSDSAVDTLLATLNPVLEAPLQRDAVLHTSCAVESLAADGDGQDVVHQQAVDGAALVSVLGPRPTTIRALAEQAVSAATPQAGPAWTRDAVLPGGELPDRDLRKTHRALGLAFPHLRHGSLAALMRRHGMLTPTVLGDAERPRDLGAELAPGLSELELRWMVEHEWARTVDDVLWRRTRLAPGVDDEQRAALEQALQALLAG